MKIKWLGHSCFLIVSETGLRIITDPYTAGGGIKYAPVNEAADVVTVSHGHADHNAFSSVPGNPEVIKSSGLKDCKGTQFKGIATYHDDSEGRQRGSNIVFCFSMEGIGVCHLGDLGHGLSREQVNNIGKVDLLFIPVGGFFTIDARTATQVCDDLKPKIIIPMHYKMPKVDFPIVGVEDFVRGKANVRRLEVSEAEFKAGHLPDVSEIVVFSPAL